MLSTETSQTGRFLFTFSSFSHFLYFFIGFFWGLLRLVAFAGKPAAVASSCNITHILPKVMQIVYIILSYSSQTDLLYIQTAVNTEFPNLIEVSSYCAYFLNLCIKKNCILWICSKAAMLLKFIFWVVGVSVPNFSATYRIFLEIFWLINVNVPRVVSQVWPCICLVFKVTPLRLSPSPTSWSWFPSHDWVAWSVEKFKVSFYKPVRVFHRIIHPPHCQQIYLEQHSSGKKIIHSWEWFIWSNTVKSFRPRDVAAKWIFWSNQNPILFTFSFL